jgi:hypothetical protein
MPILRRSPWKSRPTEQAAVGFSLSMRGFLPTLLSPDPSKETNPRSKKWFMILITVGELMPVRLLISARDISPPKR